MGRRTDFEYGEGAPSAKRSFQNYKIKPAVRSPSPSERRLTRGFIPMSNILRGKKMNIDNAEALDGESTAGDSCFLADQKGDRSDQHGGT